MRTQRPAAWHLMAALPLALCFTGIATAQSQPLDEVVVSAQRVVATAVLGRSSSGVPSELVSISFRINYADLDLSKSADVSTLQSRLESAARAGCQQLDKLYPFTPREAPSCLKKALKDSSAQMQNAIAAANAKSKTLR